MKKVSLVRCEEYDYTKVKNAMLKSIENLGGLDPYIKKGEKVLLKVNLLAKRKPEQATTTHPSVVKALAEILVENGNTVIIGDSPGGPFSTKILTGLYQATGMTDCEEVGATLNYNVGSYVKNNPNGLVMKKLTITDMLNDVDKVISVSKLKTHGMMTFTGAVKNLFGIVPGTIKAEYHLNTPEYSDFADALLDICLVANPVLSFMDGIVGMEGAGPSSGDPRDVNVIIASDSPFHLDKVAVSIINLSFDKVPTINRSIHWGLCSGDMSDVELVGGNISDFFISDFNVPQINVTNPMNRIPKPVETVLNAMFQSKPVFKHNMCIGCGICEESCPAKIISNSRDKKPVANLSKCIRCYCCQELCPKKAVEIHRPFLLNAISKIKSK